MSDQCKISVCLATYNGEKYIKDQVISILHQLGPKDELIVSDDYSSDNTVKIIESFNDSRIKIYFNHSGKKKIFHNFENAIKQSSGDYIFLADQDDIWLPDKVLTFLEVFSNTNSELVFSDCSVVDEDLSIRYLSYRSFYKFKTGFLQSFLLNPYLGCCMAFKKSVLKKIIPFPSYIPMHDIWIGIVCEYFYKVSVIEKPLILYRRHSNNATPYTATQKSKNSIFKKIIFRVNMIRGLSIALFR